MTKILIWDVMDVLLLITLTMKMMMKYRCDFLPIHHSLVCYFCHVDDVVDAMLIVQLEVSPNPHLLHDFWMILVMMMMMTMMMILKEDFWTRQEI